MGEGPEEKVETDSYIERAARKKYRWCYREAASIGGANGKCAMFGCVENTAAKVGKVVGRAKQNTFGQRRRLKGKTAAGSPCQGSSVWKLGRKQEVKSKQTSFNRKLAEKKKACGERQKLPIPKTACARLAIGKA